MASRDLKITYVGDARGLQRTLGQISADHETLGSKLKSLGSSMSSAGRSMTLGFTLPLVAAGKVALDEFTEFQQVNAQTAAALKSTGGAAGVTAGHIQDLSGRIGDLSAVDGEVVQSMENILLTFPRLRNEVGAGNDVFDQASLAVADLSARLGKDLNSSAIMVGKALNDPIAGMTALSRAGVQLTDEQKELITTMVESGDVMGAQKIILAELTTEFGGSAKAMGDTASPAAKLALTLRDLAQDAGQFLVPILEKVSGWLKTASEWFSNLSDEQKKTIVQIAAVVAAAGPLLIVFGKLTSATGSLVGGISKMIGTGAGGGLVGLGIALAAVGVALAIESSEFDKLEDHIVSTTEKGVLLRRIQDLARDSTNEWTGAIGLATDASEKQKLKLATLIGVVNEYHGGVSAARQATLEWYLKTGQIESALALLQGEVKSIMGPLRNLLSYEQRLAEAAGDMAQKHLHAAGAIAAVTAAANSAGGGGGGTGGNGGNGGGNGGTGGSPQQQVTVVNLNVAGSAMIDREWLAKMQQEAQRVKTRNAFVSGF